MGKTGIGLKFGRASNLYQALHALARFSGDDCYGSAQGQDSHRGHADPPAGLNSPGRIQNGNYISNVRETVLGPNLQTPSQHGRPTVRKMVAARQNQVVTGPLWALSGEHFADDDAQGKLVGG